MDVFVIAVLKPQILEELERLRDMELAERREKRRKSAEEDAAKKERDRKAPVGGGLGKEANCETQTSSVAQVLDDPDRTLEFSPPAPSMEVRSLLNILEKQTLKISMKFLYDGL